MKDQAKQCHQRDVISKHRKLQLKAVAGFALFITVFTVAQIIVEAI